MLNEPEAAREAFYARKCGKCLWGFRYSQLDGFRSSQQRFGDADHAISGTIVTLEKARDKRDAPREKI
jgi:hypothetical protein